MARIVYGVQGEGNGHAVRSGAVIEYLLSKGHEVWVVGGGKAEKYLQGRVPHFLPISFFELSYKDNSIHNSSIILANTRKVHGIVRSFRRVAKLMREVKPDVVFTDYEAISAYNAHILGLPIVSIGNHKIIDNPHIEFPPKHYKAYKRVRYINRLLIPVSTYDIVLTFFEHVNPSPKQFFVKPILRENVMKLKPEKKDYVLVYQTSSSNKKLISILHKVKQKFVVYGFDTNRKKKNIQFRKFNEEHFFEELSGARAVITNGGFTLVSEALYMHKPILCIPIKQQFEQILTGVYVKKMKFGHCIETTSQRGIEHFLNHLDEYEKCIKSYKRYKNKDAFNAIDSILEKVQNSTR